MILIHPVKLIDTSKPIRPDALETTCLMRWFPMFKKWCTLLKKKGSITFQDILVKETRNWQELLSDFENFVASDWIDARNSAFKGSSYHLLRNLKRVVFW